jgi:protein SCO1
MLSVTPVRLRPTHLAKFERLSVVRAVLRRAQDDRCLALTLTLLFCLAIPAQALSPNELSRIGFDQHIGRQLTRNLTFRDETGRLVSLGNYFANKPTLLVLGYSRCPMLCTLINTGLIQSLQELRLDVGKDFNVLDISIDAEETSTAAAAKKRQYIRRYGRPGASEGWHSLTGDEGVIAQLTNEAGFGFVYDRDSNEFAHPSGFIVLTSSGKISRYFLGVNSNPQELRSAIIAAGQEERGSIVQQLALICFHYHPITGKYGVLIMSVLRVCGALTLLATGLGIVWMTRRTGHA